MPPPPWKPWHLVCPSNRGLGHALTRLLLLRTHPSEPILATTRAPDSSSSSLRESLLKDLPSSCAPHRLKIVSGVDVTDEASVAEAARKASLFFPPEHSYRLSCAFALPGILRVERSLRDVDVDEAVELFRVNAVGNLVLAKHFFPFLPRRVDHRRRRRLPSEDEQDSSSSLPPPPHHHHATWLSVAARVGSTTDNRAGGWFSYRASKAAVFSLARSLDLALQARCGPAAMAVAYHPGTVRTDFSRHFWHNVPHEKLFSPEYAAEKLLQVVWGLKLDQRGKCWDWQGLEVPP
ncbi:hypothetical protein L249_8299 [Ophiocordyceps polyrhachis-furcata BCC 54312]|uniref:Uncharacterized protein n=1 Tax=Ophiocordyceps polyrhachis-furcata BCC 54312 TaxID=1330021 RepID=A0A367LHY0_9HYPO|nr:hypothetical protein L249_8299 [Ophiocordyceps polyrhachis-furcata BCC 54312]